MAKRKRKLWFEEYRCGCVSEYVKYKKDLLGYCATHGENRRGAYRVPVKEGDDDE